MSYELPLLKRQIETQLDEYEQAIAAFKAFMEARAPKPKTIMYSEELPHSQAVR
jgi:hypothetical protein